MTPFADSTVVFTMLVLALASARLTRLVTRDKITRPAVDALVNRFHARAERRLDRVQVPDDGWHLALSRQRRAVRRARRADGLARWVTDLVTCGWCASVWTSAALVAAWWAWTPSTWLPAVVYALAAAEVAGQIRSRD